jgi:hypothetical protein
MRIKRHKNECASILFLRKNLGYTVTAISQILGRSTSLVHRVLKFNKLIGNLSHADLRKIPCRLRLRTAQKHRLSMERIIGLWLPFVLGESDKPP